jgi:hypothetical protein
MPLINYIGNRQEALAGGTGGFVRGNAPPPPALSFDYLIVGGGMVRGAGIGGSAGGFLSGSAATMSFNTTIDIQVGAGGSGSNNNGYSSSMSGSSFAYLYAGGASTTFSGYPQGNQEGTGGPNTNGGGAGASQNGVNGIPRLSGRGGNGLAWVDGNFYAGGGGGGGTQFAGQGAAGTGGGGIGIPGDVGGTTPGTNGVDGTGGGGGGGMQKGGSGIVIIRYATASVVAPYDNAIDGGSLSITGGYAYRTFTGSAQLNYRF